MVSPVGTQSERRISKLDNMRGVRVKTREAQQKRTITKKDIDLDSVEAMAKLMMSQTEMGSVLGIGTSGVNKFLDTWPEFAEAVDRGYADTRKALRRTQLDLALSGHASMLMWLGKQYLGQADKHEQHTKTEVSITVQRAMDELRNIPRGQLLAAQALLSAPVVEQGPAANLENQSVESEGGDPC